MTNFHEFQHLYESLSTARRAHASVSPRWGNIRWQVLCHRCSEPAQHITSLLTQHQDRGVIRRRRNRVVDTKSLRCPWWACRGQPAPHMQSGQTGGLLSLQADGEMFDWKNTNPRKPQFGPDILNQLHASAWSSHSNLILQLGSSHLIWSVRYHGGHSSSPRQCLTHLPRLLYTPRGNQATDESEPRCLTSSGWTKFGNTIYAIYIEDNVTVLKVSLNIVKDLCQIDLTPIRNFKYCFTIENKWFRSLQT